MAVACVRSERPSNPLIGFISASSITFSQVICPPTRPSHLPRGNFRAPYNRHGILTIHGLAIITRPRSSVSHDKYFKCIFSRQDNSSVACYRVANKRRFHLHNVYLIIAMLNLNLLTFKMNIHYYYFLTFFLHDCFYKQARNNNEENESSDLFEWKSVLIDLHNLTWNLCHCD